MPTIIGDGDCLIKVSDVGVISDSKGNFYTLERALVEAYDAERRHEYMFADNLKKAHKVAKLITDNLKLEIKDLDQDKPDIGEQMRFQFLGL